MIDISFSLPAASSPWRQTWDDARRLDPKVISEMDLRYKYFGVNVELVVGGLELISRRKFVTLVDLALSFRGVVDRVSRGEDATFGFTESANVINIRQQEGGLSVGSSTRSEIASVSSEELVDGLSRFIREAHGKLLQEIPGLAGNPIIQRLGPSAVI